MTSETTIIQKSNKKRAYRKKNENEATEEEDQNLLQMALNKDGNEEAMRLKLLQTKELQKMRGRAKGVKAGVATDLSTSVTSQYPKINSMFMY